MERSTTLPKPHPAAVFKPVSDGGVLLHTESEIYFGLNEVGVLIWESLPPECADLEGLCERISARYPDVDLETIRADAVELIETLEEKQLVTKEG